MPWSIVSRRAIRDGQDEVSESASVVDALSPQFGDWRGFEGLGDSIPDVYRKAKTVTGDR